MHTHPGRAAWLPLDPEWPAARLRGILEEAAPAAVLCAGPEQPGGAGTGGSEGSGIHSESVGFHPGCRSQQHSSLLHVLLTSGSQVHVRMF